MRQLMNKVIVYPLVTHASYSKGIEVNMTFLGLVIVGARSRYSPSLATPTKGFTRIIKELQRDIRQFPKVLLLDSGKDSLDRGSPHSMPLFEARMVRDQPLDIIPHQPPPCQDKYHLLGRFCGAKPGKNKNRDLTFSGAFGKNFFSDLDNR
jgi:hypothetical protein